MVKALILFLKIYTYSCFDFLVFQMLFTKKKFQNQKFKFVKESKIEKIKCISMAKRKKIELTQKGDVGDKQGGKKRMIRKI